MSQPDLTQSVSVAGNILDAPAAERFRATTVIFRARKLVKTYQMGDVEVYALRSLDLVGGLVLRFQTHSVEGS